jgi:uncharacterized cupredoxin-like copper-binding protein
MTAPTSRTGLLLATGLIAIAAVVLSLGVACGSGTEVEPEPDPEPEAGASPEPEAEPGAAATVLPGTVEPAPTDAAQVFVTLGEWAVSPETTSVPAGEVYFLADNAGAQPHELVVIRTDLAEDELPVVDDRVPEDDVDIIGEIEPFAANSQASTVLDLEPGAYVLICNIAQHYGEGMHSAFTVE